MRERPSVKNLSRTRSAIEPGSPRILILRAGAIGDTLMATPLVRAFRRTFPNAHLVFLCSRTACDILRGNPHLDQVIPLSYRRLPTWSSSEKLRAVRELRRLNLDWALALESHPRLVQLALQARAKRTIGYAEMPGSDGYERATFDPKRHSIENHLCAALPTGVRRDGFEMELHYPPSIDLVLRERLEHGGIKESDCLVGVHAGWGGRAHPAGPDQTRLRSWPAENFAEVIRWLVGRVGARVILTGGEVDHPLNDAIASLASVPTLNLAGQLSLPEMAALIRRLRVYLTVDTGPAHMAAALGTPLITLWGPGIFEQTAPLAGRGSVCILYRRVACAPCYGTPLMQSCRDNICMKQIEVEEVIAAIQHTLATPQPVKQESIQESL